MVAGNILPCYFKQAKSTAQFNPAEATAVRENQLKYQHIFLTNLKNRQKIMNRVKVQP